MHFVRSVHHISSGMQPFDEGILTIPSEILAGELQLRPPNLQLALSSQPMHPYLRYKQGMDSIRVCISPSQWQPLTVRLEGSNVVQSVCRLQMLSEKC